MAFFTLFPECTLSATPQSENSYPYSHWWQLLCIYATFMSLCVNAVYSITLQWRHNGHDVSNHQPHDCLLNHLFRHISKKTSKLHITGLYAENSPGTGESPALMASNAENVSIWWRHHVYLMNSCDQFTHIHQSSFSVSKVNLKDYG